MGDGKTGVTNYKLQNDVGGGGGEGEPTNQPKKQTTKHQKNNKEKNKVSLTSGIEGDLTGRFKKKKKKLAAMVCN